jgi:CxxC-x17-CxxC domain-containing protein
MSLQDKNLTCSECGSPFTFSVQDQEFYQSKGYTNEPKRCPTCRQARKSERNGTSGGYSSGYGSPRQMYPVTCSQCGKATEVPFEPRSGRPVYCSDCFSKVRTNR